MPEILESNSTSGTSEKKTGAGTSVLSQDGCTSHRVRPHIGRQGSLYLVLTKIMNKCELWFGLKASSIIELTEENTKHATTSLKYTMKDYRRCNSTLKPISDFLVLAAFIPTLAFVLLVGQPAAVYTLAQDIR